MWSAAPSVEAYSSEPRGRYVAGPTFLHLCEDTGTFATFIWARPSASDVGRLVAALRAEMQPHASPHASYADVRGLTGVDPDSYAALAHYFESVRGQSATRITAQAVVYGAGLAASVAVGFWEVYAPAFPYRAFVDPHAATAWLGLPPDSLASWEALRDAVARVPEELSALRSWLTANFKQPSLLTGARALGVSDRTLQRRLREAGTSFQKELDVVRSVEARARLEGRDDKLAQIAEELGFATHQAFTDWFRKQEGESPSEYRDRRKK